ncbi:MAG: hypothetical protein KF824_10470 [Fimbriimonadaceae bacterium]|nr:MAG: hypothetical protein KF824_10470 [Fimbriimonadaceae bacterium]
MDSLKPFILGSLATFVIGSALFGASAYAEFNQELIGKQQSTHLITLKEDSFTLMISADLIDLVNAFHTENGVEVHISSVNDLSGEVKEIASLTVTAKEFNNFMAEVNKYRK